MHTNAITREVSAQQCAFTPRSAPDYWKAPIELVCSELELRGLRYETEVPVPVTYRGLTIPTAYRMDLLVEDVVIVETKALSRMTENHEAQLLSHLRLSRRTVGLLINFHVRHLRHGIKRLVNNYKGARVEDAQ